MKTLTIIAAMILLVTGEAYAQLAPGTLYFDFTKGPTVFNSLWQVTGGTWTPAGLYLPGSSYAIWNTMVPNGGGGGATVPFGIEADVFIGDSNYLRDSGIGAMRNGDGKGPEVVGSDAAHQGVSSDDKSWNNVLSRASNGLAVGGWTTLKLDHGWTKTGQWAAYYKAVEGNTGGYTPGTWIQIGTWQPVQPSDVFPTFRIGSQNNSFYGGSAAQMTISSLRVNMYFGPEPGSLLVMGAGLLGFAGLVRRK